MLQLTDRNVQNTAMRLSTNGRTLLIYSRNWFGKGREQIREIPLNSICDYHLSQDKKLVLYVFDSTNSVAEWKKVKKLKAVDTSAIDGTSRQLMLAKIKEMVRTNQQLGLQKPSWFYMSMPVNLDFG